MPKEKSPKKCPSCATLIHFTHGQDLVTCWSCGEQFATGYEEEIRRRLEKNCAGNPEYPYPPYTVARAISYASAIYGMATHGEEFDGTKIENRLQVLSQEKEKFRNGAIATSELVAGTQQHRGLRGMTDRRYGYIMVVVTGRHHNENFQQIYIVMRGSRSDTGHKNPLNAGYDIIDGRSYNVDYAANFTGTYMRTPWADEHILVKQGFMELYESFRHDVANHLRTQLRRYPRAQVIITGHSLGAALAVLCAHHIQYHFADRIADRGPFCFPFCTPKVGNANFAFDFKVKLGEPKARVRGEPNESLLYRRSINFIQNDDPVSFGGTYGYKSDKARSLDPNVNKGPKAAHKGGLAKKAWYGVVKSLPWKRDQKIIFYQTPNVYKIGWFIPPHTYQGVQKYFLGESLYNT